MATDKKSFILYAELINVVEKLNDEQAGILFKHVLRYVNDQNPVAPDQFTEVIFEPIRLMLKRDLVKYENIREKNKDNAKKRWDAVAFDRIQSNTYDAVNVNDNDNDIVNKENINRIDDRKRSFYNSLKNYLPEYSKGLLREFYEYWTEHGPKDRKMRYEKEKSFDVNRRLKTWSANQKKFGKVDTSDDDKNLYLNVMKQIKKK
jgi:hypothetical protein